MEGGLRERKKQRTREAIVEAAFRLFHERGYDGTTVADIAAAADIAPRTFFGYFATKEDVVFHDFEDTLAAFRARILERPAGETAMDAMRAWIQDHVAGPAFDDPEQRRRRLLVKATPALRDADQAKMHHLGEVLAAGVARDLGLPADGLRPQMVAAAATAALMALDEFFQDREDEPPAEQALEILDDALAFLRGGVDALRRR